MGNLIPNQPIKYSTDCNGVVWARYINYPYSSKPEWIVGGPCEAVLELLTQKEAQE